MVLVDAITLMRPTPRIHAPYTSPTPLLRGFVRVLSNTGIFFKKNARCLKSNVKAAAYAAQCRFCYAHRAVTHRRQQDTPGEKGQKQDHCKSQKHHHFSRRIGGRQSAEIAAFLLVSNIKIRC
ncbi:hypothetical protein D3C73_280770 [compost metagenome]